MPLRVRHLRKKVLIYGMLLATMLILLLALIYANIEREVILLLVLALVLMYMAAYPLFIHAAIILLRAKVITAADEPRIFHIIERLSKSKGIKMPVIAVLQGRTADTFVSGVCRDRTILFFSRGLLEEFSDRELEEILRSELDLIDELGLLVYNVTTRIFSLPGAVATGIERWQRFRHAAVTRDTGVPQLTIEKASVSDVPEVVRLLVSHGMYNYFSLHSLNRLAREKSPFFLAAHYGGSLAGFAVGERDRRLLQSKGHLCKMIVAERFREMGIGSSLILSFIDTSKQNGCDSCHLEVRANNFKAIALYEKNGFRKEKVINTYYQDGSGCLIMALNKA
jgi:ribosomal protein S18 acetylase RimI-like enzyme